MIHWVLVLMSFVLLGLGWYIQYMPPPPLARSFLLDLHISLGVTIAILLSIQIALWIVFKPPSSPNVFLKWKKLLAYTLYLLIYASFSLMLISGYLGTVFSGTPIRFWGTPLPAWGVVDVMLAGFFGTVHRVVAFCISRIDCCACRYRWPEYIQAPWHCGPNGAIWAARVASGCPRGSEIPNCV